MFTGPFLRRHLQTLPDSIFRKSFVRIAVQPTFSPLRRCDHGMFARLRVRGRMAVRRVIATARRAAFLAYAQMNPTSAYFHALIALTAF